MSLGIWIAVDATRSPLIPARSSCILEHRTHISFGGYLVRLLLP
jgi:hypothetical protein